MLISKDSANFAMSRMRIFTVHSGFLSASATHNVADKVGFSPLDRHDKPAGRHKHGYAEHIKYNNPKRKLGHGINLPRDVVVQAPGAWPVRTSGSGTSPL